MESKLFLLFVIVLIGIQSTKGEEKASEFHSNIQKKPDCDKFAKSDKKYARAEAAIPPARFQAETGKWSIGTAADAVSVDACLDKLKNTDKVIIFTATGASAENLASWPKNTQNAWLNLEVAVGPGGSGKASALTAIPDDQFGGVLFSFVEKEAANSKYDTGMLSGLKKSIDAVTTNSKKNIQLNSKLMHGVTVEELKPLVDLKPASFVVYQNKRAADASDAVDVEPIEKQLAGAHHIIFDVGFTKGKKTTPTGATKMTSDHTDYSNVTDPYSEWTQPENDSSTQHPGGASQITCSIWMGILLLLGLF